MLEIYIFVGMLATMQPPYQLLPEDTSPEKKLSQLLSYEYIIPSRR
jgi:hypothetical protein